MKKFTTIPQNIKIDIIVATLGYSSLWYLVF